MKLCFWIVVGSVGSVVDGKLMRATREKRKSRPDGNRDRTGSVSFAENRIAPIQSPDADSFESCQDFRLLPSLDSRSYM